MIFTPQKGYKVQKNIIFTLIPDKICQNTLFLFNFFLYILFSIIIFKQTSRGHMFFYVCIQSRKMNAPENIYNKIESKSKFKHMS